MHYKSCCLVANNLKCIYTVVAYDLQLRNKTCKYAKIRPLIMNDMK